MLIHLQFILTTSGTILDLLFEISTMVPCCGCLSKIANVGLWVSSYEQTHPLSLSLML